MHAASIVSVLSFFFFLALSHQILHRLLLHGNENDRLETLTHCLELFKLASQYQIYYCKTVSWPLTMQTSTQYNSCKTVVKKL